MILCKARMKKSQKFSLATFFCLNVITIIVTVVKMSGVRTHGANGTKAVDVVWGLFWLFVQACISVMTVSLIAFRTALAVKTRKKQRQWYQPRNNWNQRKPFPDDGCSIPSITTIGMRTMSRGTTNRDSRVYETWDPDWPLPSNTGLLVKAASNNELQENKRSVDEVSMHDP